MKTTRSYTMRARADATEQTRARIVQAATELTDSRPIASIALPDVAKGAGVSVQTILRQFGSRDGLLDAAIAVGAAEVSEERRATPGDIDGALGVLMDHYERGGDRVLLILGQEKWDERAKQITDNGRAIHRQWVQDVFAPLLTERSATTDELVDLLVVATDVYTWKLLRRDRALSRQATQRRMRRLVDAILEE